MAEVYTTTWKKAGFFPDLPKLLKPRILAEGYSLQSEDEGKQVYVKPGHGAKRWFGEPSQTQKSESATLTISYILFPQRTEVTFKWESCYHCDTLIRNRFGNLAQGFYDYLNEWFEAVGQHKELDDGSANS